MIDFEGPVIGVFTKYDQFKLNVEMDLEDDPDRLGSVTPETMFREHYLCRLGDGARFVQLESALGSHSSAMC
jgi:hypothetical protein